MERVSNNELMKRIKCLKYFSNLHSCPSGVCQEKHCFMCVVEDLLIFEVIYGENMHIYCCVGHFIE